jgi:hypothetical protein
MELMIQDQELEFDVVKMIHGGFGNQVQSYLGEFHS